MEELEFGDVASTSKEDKRVASVLGYMSPEIKKQKRLASVGYSALGSVENAGHPGAFLNSWLASDFSLLGSKQCLGVVLKHAMASVYFCLVVSMIEL